MSDNNPIRCHNCAHFFITWETEHPYGCHVMNFKGKQIPSAIVLKTSGQRCRLFKAKEKKVFNQS